MEIFNALLLVFLIISAIAVSSIKNLMASVIVFMAYGLVMAIVWQQLNAPDLAITEAAIGAGVTTLLFIKTLRNIRGTK